MYWICIVYSYYIKTKFPSSLEIFLHVVRYNLGMKKNGRTTGLPERDYPARKRGLHKGLGGNYDELCSQINEWWQTGTMREVRENSEFQS